MYWSYLRRVDYGHHLSIPHLVKEDGSLNGYGMIIYTIETGKYYKSRHFFPKELTIKHLLEPTSLQEKL